MPENAPRMTATGRRSRRVTPCHRIALPLLGIWRWRFFGNHKAIAAALWTGDKSLALALGTNLARPNDNPGVVPGVSSALACQACHLFFASATRTLLLDFAHRNPSFHAEPLVNRDSPCLVRCLRRQIIRDPSAPHYPQPPRRPRALQHQLIDAGCHHLHRGLLPGHYLTARTRMKSRAPFGCIMAPTGLNMFPSKLANRSRSPRL